MIQFEDCPLPTFAFKKFIHFTLNRSNFFLRETLFTAMIQNKSKTTEDSVPFERATF